MLSYQVMQLKLPSTLSYSKLCDLDCCVTLTVQSWPHEIFLYSTVTALK